ncbi:MAG: GNAT family N-acetyltransferase [Roseiflexaceae bacterium]
MLRRATHDDVSQLAQMNWQLIRDEGSDNPMTIEQLAERMTGLLATTYHAWIIQPEQQAIGYILVDIGRTPVYLRQMYIAASYRRCGYGRAAFVALCDELTHVPLEVESFAWNSPAVAFWQSVGFTPCVI